VSEVSSAFTEGVDASEVGVRGLVGVKGDEGVPVDVLNEEEHAAVTVSVALELV
jgi:hypothetical protein